MTLLRGLVDTAQLLTKPAPAAPTGEKVVDAEGEEVGVPGVRSVPEMPPEGELLVKQEVSLLPPTVIVALQPSFPAASTTKIST